MKIIQESIYKLKRSYGLPIRKKRDTVPATNLQELLQDKGSGTDYLNNILNPVIVFVFTHYH
ncbi:hypothetical protein KN1_28010 [Stygiolobus caldivivus]|uniref:Uncharacterized protein n=1 Tax=Stygiolobus caldivivus TaxID=2824673 RepID=A0A8D5ZJE7_9CREN|nr:hypothetical protein KN1_28010 [Stygiolobus caldivivus]